MGINLFLLGSTAGVSVPNPLMGAVAFVLLVFFYMTPHVVCNVLVITIELPLFSFASLLRFMHDVHSFFSFYMLLHGFIFHLIA